MYFPAISYLRSQVIPESHRANVMNWFRSAIGNHHKIYLFNYYAIHIPNSWYISLCYNDMRNTLPQAGSRRSCWVYTGLRGTTCLRGKVLSISLYLSRERAQRYQLFGKQIWIYIYIYIHTTSACQTMRDNRTKQKLPVYTFFLKSPTLRLVFSMCI